MACWCLQAATAEADALRQALEAHRRETAHDTRVIAATQRAGAAEQETQRANLQCEALRHQAAELREQLTEERALRRSMRLGAAYLRHASAGEHSGARAQRSAADARALPWGRPTPGVDVMRSGSAVQIDSAASHADGNLLEGHRNWGKRNG